MKVILATRNQGKIREFQKRFSEIGWEVIPISDIADIPEPEETGTTFRENALQKPVTMLKLLICRCFQMIPEL